MIHAPSTRRWGMARGLQRLAFGKADLDSEQG